MYNISRNPFIYSASPIELMEIGTRNYVVSDNSTTGVPPDQISRTYLADRTSKTCVYYKSYVAEDFINKLSAPALKLFIYIIYKLPDNQDWIKIKIKTLQEQLNFKSTRTVAKALKCLVDTCVICKKSQSEYWVDPKVLFKGDRVSFYLKNHPDCVKVVAKIQANSVVPLSGVVREPVVEYAASKHS